MNDGLYIIRYNEYAARSGEYNRFSECEMEAYLLDRSSLYDFFQKDNHDERSTCTGELRIPNTSFEPLHYTLTYIQPVNNPELCP
ncbi:hypothetical protein SAMN05216516_109113 [Izhakiella capsodis]|uniref:Uncharacterized protein n=1 Tax=Izhakiella capsodis TaxID=1367852 RepID=A0A1I4ZS61_9GAMM|nr:hypothetical protein SAMN05216516_109113 [Izhakiella capsodis]